MSSLIMQTWTESVPGWGQRPDGTSFHLNVEDMEAYNKALSIALPGCPEYSRPDENPVEVEVTEEFFNMVAKSGQGWRTWKQYKVVTTNRLVEV